MAATAKHSPAPWEVWNKDDTVVASATGYVCRIGVPEREYLTAEQCANRALIAAAPDLLEACRILCDPDTDRITEAHNLARAAIAKATP